MLWGVFTLWCLFHFSIVKKNISLNSSIVSFSVSFFCAGDMKRLWNSSTGGYMLTGEWVNKWCLPCVLCPWFFLTPAYCTYFFEFFEGFCHFSWHVRGTPDILVFTSSSASGFKLCLLFSPLLMISDVPLIQEEEEEVGGRISRAVLTSSPPMPRQRQHGGGHYISAPPSPFVIEIVGAVLSSACFVFFLSGGLI